MSNRHHQDIAFALVDTAIDAGTLPQVVHDIELIAQVFAETSSFKQNLSETIVPLEQRCTALKKAVGTELHPFVLNALQLLMSKQALDEFDSFHENVRALAAEKGNHREVEVTSAIELDESEKQHIAKSLEKKWKGTVQLKTKIDATILGGLQFKSGTWSHDASLKGRIQRLQKTLAT